MHGPMEPIDMTQTRFASHCSVVQPHASDPAVDELRFPAPRANADEISDARVIAVVHAIPTIFPTSLEAGWSAPGEYRELVRLAALRVEKDGERQSVSRRIDFFVRPTLNMTVSHSLTALTGITQMDLDVAGVSTSKAFSELAMITDGALTVCLPDCSLILRETAHVNRIPMPVGTETMKTLDDVLSNEDLDRADVSEEFANSHPALHVDRLHHILAQMHHQPA